jgi:hypothetical protein
MSCMAAFVVEERVEYAFGFSSKQMDKLYKSLFLSAVKRLMAAAPRAQHLAAQQKAFAEAQALTKADRVAAVEARLDDVFTRLEVRLPAFLSALS